MSIAFKKFQNVAIVNDWLIGGGAERVVLELHRMFPDAPIYSSYCTDEWRERLDNKVVTGWLQHFGKLRKFLAVARIWWFEHLDLSAYDLVISVSGNGESFGVKTSKETTTHVCYCHTPTHYYWRHYEQYVQHPGFGRLDPLARIGLRILIDPLRKWDLRASTRPTYFIANSTHIQRDIQKYYNRESVIIHPPIDVERFSNAPVQKRHGFVTMGRQTPYKRNDLIVQACTQLGIPLKVIGRGPDHDHLVKLSGPTITFLTGVSDEDLPKELASAKAFLFAAFEDFGVAPVEALATSTPLIAYEAGGALDYTIPGKTGMFFPEQSVESLITAIQNFDTTQYVPKELLAFAQTFSAEAFQKKMHTFLDKIDT